MHIPHVFSASDLQYVVALLLGLLCGIVIGRERELKKKPAGISTQTLVIGAAVTFTFISQTVSAGDKTRIAAQIISGVGFLGAGIILRRENSKRVANLTTAASIWYSAAIGMAFGFQMYAIGIIATLYAVITSRIPSVNKRNTDDP